MLIDLLPKLEPPILTVYFDTNPAKASNQGTPSGARIWLKSQGKALQADVPRVEQKVFRTQLERVDRFLETRPKRERGIMLVAGSKVWRVLRLQVDVDNELHRGGVVRTELLWLPDEHQPCGVAVVDRSGARFYRFWMGEVSEQKTEQFEVDTSQWRAKNMVRSGGRPAPRTVMLSINALRSIMRGCSVRQPNGFPCAILNGLGPFKRCIEELLPPEPYCLCTLPFTCIPDGAPSIVRTYPYHSHV